MEETKEDVSYEEWKSATRFARYRYKYGLFVLILCWISLITLCFLIWNYQHELTTDPAIYTLNRLDSEYCFCYGEGVTYYINKSGITWSESFFNP